MSSPRRWPKAYAPDGKLVIKEGGKFDPAREIVEFSISDLYNAVLGSKKIGVKEEDRRNWLGEKHDTYKRWESLWRYYEQSYCGGPWINRQDYIYQHPRESDQMTDSAIGSSIRARRERAWFVNFNRFAVDSMVMTIWSNPISRETPSGWRTSAGKKNAEAPFWDTFKKDVDRSGRGIDEFMRHCATWCQVFGVYHVLVDSPSRAWQLSASGKGSIDSLQDVLDIEAWPYFVPYSPLDVMNWGTTEAGKIWWVVLRSKHVIQVPFHKKIKTTVYRLVTKNRIFVFNEKGKLLTTSEHNLGALPIVTLRWGAAPLGTMESSSALEEVAPINQACDNYRSLRDEGLYNQTFSQLCIASENPEDIKEIRTGTTSVIGYPPGLSPPMYISPDASQTEVLRAAIDDCRTEVFRTMYDRFYATREPLRMSQAQSGTAQAWEFHRREFSIVDFARRLEEFERRIHRVRGAMITESSMEEVSDDVIVTPAYPKEFDLNEPGKLLHRFAQTDEVFGEAVPAIARASGLKMVLPRVYPKLDDSETEQAMAEIENWIGRENLRKEMQAEAEANPNPLVEENQGVGAPPPRTA